MKKFLLLFGVLALFSGLLITKSLAITSANLIENASLTISANSTQSVATDTSAYNNLQLSFNYDSKLEDSEAFIYGWRLGDTGAEHQLGTVNGSRTGNKSISISDSSASANNFEIYITNNGSSSNASDDVTITNINLTGDLVVTNTAPSANSLSISTNENQATSSQLSGTDTDGDTLTYATTSNPTLGTITSFDSTTGDFTYTPNTDATGTDSFNFVVSDGQATSTEETVNITINEVSTPVTPTFSAPTNLNVSNLASTSLTLNWDNVTDATSYEVLQNNTSLATTSATSYDVTGLSASTTYSFSVVATNGTDFSTSTPVSTTTLADTTSGGGSGSGSGSGGGTSTSTVVEIHNLSELENAIENQASGQTWNIYNNGTGYGVTPNNNVSAGGQTGWYFPITANNLTINGIGNPTIYGTGYVTNGNWATQDFIAIFGNNVTLNGLTLMPKIEPNKTIEVLGSNTTLQNLTLKVNTLTDQSEYDSIPNVQDRSDEKQWGGSIYYNDATGTQTLENINIYNGGISLHSPNASFSVSNVNIDYASNVDWINDYRFYLGNAPLSITGAPSYTYHVSDTLNNLDSVLAAVGDPTTVGTDTIVLDSDISVDHQITLNKDNVTFKGNNHTITPTFTKTDNDNNSTIGVIGANNVTIQELKIDGTNGTNLHGINIFQSPNTTLWRVTSENNDYTGINVNGSKVVATDITTSGNGWHGVDVDKDGAWLKVAGINHYNENPGVPAIYFDAWDPSKVLFATGDQFTYKDNYLVSGDRAYFNALATSSVTLVDASGTNILNGGYIRTDNFTFTLDSGDRSITGYKIKYWNNIASSTYNGESNAWQVGNPNSYVTVSNGVGTYQDHFSQGEGTHYFEFSACNGSTCSAYTEPFEVTYDHTAPVIVNFTPASGTIIYKNATTTFTFDIEDNISMDTRIAGQDNGKQYMWFELVDSKGNISTTTSLWGHEQWGGTNLVVDKNDKTKASTIYANGFLDPGKLSHLTPGPVYLRVGLYVPNYYDNYLVDAAGNEFDRSKVIATYTLVDADTEAPTASFVYHGGTSTLDNNVLVGDKNVRYLKSIDDLTFDANFTDNVGLDWTSYVVWKVNDQFKSRTPVCSNWPKNSSGAHTLSGTSSSLTGVSVKACAPNATWSDGNYQLGQAVYDTAGNKFRYTPDFNFVIDSEAPTISVKDGYVGDKNSASFSNVSFQLHDNNLIDYVEINGWHMELSNNAWSDANFQNIKSHLVDGTNTITAYDVAGNSTTYTFTYDNSAPDIQINNAEVVGNPYYKLSGPINVHVSDDNLADTQVTRLNATNDNHWDYHAGHYFGLAWLRDGDYTMTATDTAGNATTVTFRVDHTKPVASGVATGGVVNASTTYNPTSFTINANDDESNNSKGDQQSGLNKVTGNIYKYDPSNPKAKPDGYYLLDSNSTTTSPFTIDLSNLADGKYYVRYNASDVAGNIASTQEFYFVVDKSIPTIEITTPVNESEVDKDTDLIVSGTATDTGAGVIGQTISIGLSDYSVNPKEFGFFTTQTKIQADGSWSVTIPANTLDGRDGHNIVISAGTRDKSAPVYGNPGSAHSNFTVEDNGGTGTTGTSTVTSNAPAIIAVSPAEGSFSLAPSENLVLRVTATDTDSDLNELEVDNNYFANPGLDQFSLYASTTDPTQNPAFAAAGVNVNYYATSSATGTVGTWVIDLGSTITQNIITQGSISFSMRTHDLVGNVSAVADSNGTWGNSNNTYTYTLTSSSSSPNNVSDLSNTTNNQNTILGGGSIPYTFSTYNPTSAPGGGLISGQVKGATAFQFPRNLGLGMTGVDVQALQVFLNNVDGGACKLADSGIGSLGQETNYFGSLTANAVKCYQEAHASNILVSAGITSGVGTGYFGNSTRGFVNTTLSNGSDESNTINEAIGKLN